jgi:hypothetical protein
MSIQDKIINGVKADAERNALGDFPLHIFPEKVKSIILDLVTYEYFKVDYVAAGMISATATAIGNTCHLRIRGNWCVAPALYMILVGRPGLGKTPPLKAAYSPIQAIQNERNRKYADEYAEMQQNRGNGDKPNPPKLVRTILSDFTPEAMKHAHNGNKHGIVILVDEIMGLFRTVNRYNNSSLVQDFLSAYSGIPFNVSRVTNPDPVYVATPCVNIIGTTQTVPLSEIFTPELLGNGFIDRFLFVYPKSQQIPLISVRDKSLRDKSTDALAAWSTILNKIIALSPFEADDKASPTILEMSPEAEEVFVTWWNEIVNADNLVKRDVDVPSRNSKRDNNTARLALIIQLLRWACGESHKEFVDAVSVKAAIELNNYFEEHYQRVLAVVNDNNLKGNEREFYDALPDSFSTDDAKPIANEIDISERSMYNYLQSLMKKNLLKQISRGSYEKIRL